MGALVGYKLDKSLTRFMGNGSLAVEAHYDMLGSYTTSFTTLSGFNFTTFQPIYTTVSSTTKISSMGADAVAMFPIPSVAKLSAFAKLGFASTSATTSGAVSGTSSVSGMVYGAGAQYDVTSKIAVRAGYQTYASDVSTIYAAAVYSF